MLASLIPGRLENVELDVTFLDDTRISAEVAQSAAAAAAAERASKRSRSTPVTYAVHLTGNVEDDYELGEMLGDGAFSVVRLARRLRKRVNGRISVT